LFENVPDWLAEKVRRIPETVAPGDREQVYLNAAGWTIALHIDISKSESDSFFQNRSVDDTGSLAWDGQSRDLGGGVIVLAAIIFEFFRILPTDEGERFAVSVF
jgi:hypothetical protein